MAGDAERLDAERLEVLRRWGRGLGDDPRDEVRAAGRAIAMLIEEIEHLHIELWHARDVDLHDAPAADEPAEPAEPPAANEEEAPPSGVDNVPGALLARVRGLFTGRRAAGS
jgi:hypothetical protein